MARPVFIVDGSRTPLVPAGRYRIVGHPGGPFALYLPVESHVDVRGDRTEPVTLTARQGGRIIAPAGASIKRCEAARAQSGTRRGRTID